MQGSGPHTAPPTLMLCLLCLMHLPSTPWPENPLSSGVGQAPAPMATKLQTWSALLLPFTPPLTHTHTQALIAIFKLSLNSTGAGVCVFQPQASPPMAPPTILSQSRARTKQHFWS